EEKILEAAGKLFSQKGYAGTKTRDIAEEAGLNLASLNYYFRSKENLFKIVMRDKTMKLFGGFFKVAVDEELSLEEKIEKMVENHAVLLLDNPYLPIFVMSEIRSNPKLFVNNFDLKEIFEDSSIIKQLREKSPGIDPIHLMLNILALTIMPFITRPILISAAVKTAGDFDQLIEDRKKLIPKWMELIME